MQGRPRLELWLVRLAIGGTVAGLAVGIILLARTWPPPPPLFGFTGWEAIVTIAFGGMGALLLARRPGNRIGWLLLLEGLATALQFAIDLAPAAASDVHASPAAIAWLAWLSNGIWIPSVALFGPIFLLFPDGRPLTRRWAPLLWVVVAGASILWLGQAVAPGELQYYAVDNPFPIRVDWYPLLVAIGGILLLVGSGLCGTSLLFRWRRSTGDAHEQMKWLAVVGVPLFVVSPIAGFSLAASYVMIGFGLAMPVAIAIAVLRHRLYDIDQLISRAVVYGALTAILAGVYAASLKILQEVFLQVTGTQSDGAVIVSTLVTAAFFSPMRKGLDHVVDRWFKRRKGAVPGGHNPAVAAMTPMADATLADLETVIRRVVREELAATQPPPASGA